MRTNVTFQHPAEFVAASDYDGILAASGAQWFVALLRNVTGLEIDERLCQEDWGVVIFVRRNKKKFWVGMSIWPDGEHAWLAHFHHAPFAWLQRFTSSGQREMQNLLADFHRALKNDSAVSEVLWHEESQMAKPQPEGFASPIET